MSAKTVSGLPYAEAKATQPGAIDLDRMALIGIFGTDTDRRALVRLASGRIEKVVPGGRLGGATVVTIDKAGLLLLSGGNERRLDMPKG